MKTSFCQQFVAPLTPDFKYAFGPSKPWTHSHPPLLWSQMKAELTTEHYFIKVEEHFFCFLSPTHMSQGEFIVCASHFWKQRTLLCKHWSYASLRYPWLHRCNELLNYILLVFQPLCLWGLLQQQKPWVWTRVYHGWQGDDIKYKSEYLNKLGSWYNPSWS